MDLLTYIKKRFTSNETISRTIGNNDLNGILSCGFLRKGEYSDIDITFKYYGALLLLDGSGKYIEANGNDIYLTPGCFIQRLPDKKHSTLVEKDGKWLEAYICFGRELYFSLLRIGIINDQKPVLKPGLNYILLQKLVSLFDSLKLATMYELPSLLIKAQEIAIMAHDLDIKQSQGNSVSIVRQASSIIDTNIYKNISVHDVANQLNIGYENFRKVFKQTAGMSPKAYIIQRRIDAAKSILLESHKNITEISEELGYENPFIFSKQFKSVVGMSPSEFKKQFLISKG